MIYKVKKQVFNSKGYEIDSWNFDVPSSFVEKLIRLLMEEGYALSDNEDNYKRLFKNFTQNDQRYYSRFQFRTYPWLS